MLLCRGLCCCAIVATVSLLSVCAVANPTIGKMLRMSFARAVYYMAGRYKRCMTWVRKMGSINILNRKHGVYGQIAAHTRSRDLPGVGNVRTRFLALHTCIHGLDNVKAWRGRAARRSPGGSFAPAAAEAGAGVVASSRAEPRPF